MGDLLVEAKITASLSRTNSDKDKRHDTLWLDFVETIRYLASNPRFKEINIQVNGPERDEDL